MIVRSTIIGGGVGSGWTVYPPLSGLLGHSAGGVDSAIFSLHTARAASIMGGINFMTTVLIFGKSQYYEISIFCWALFITVFLLVLSLPVLAARITMLLFDRNVNAVFFDSGSGGDAVLFQHLFWFFRHPEVYVLVLPAFGLLSHIILMVCGVEMQGYYGII